MAKKEAEAKEFKYGVEDFAKEADVTPASARVMLRKHSIKKAGGTTYGWDSVSEMKSVLEKCRSGSKAKSKAAPAAKKSKGKKVAKAKVRSKKRVSTRKEAAADDSHATA